MTPARKDRPFEAPPAGPATATMSLAASQAYRRYRETLPESQRLALDLFEELSVDKYLMRVLYLAWMDLEAAELPGRDGTADRSELRRRGWIFTSHGRTRLTDDGFRAWWRWKVAITPHLRKPAFQELWREVAGW
ncbi:hypothetical protein ALI22I_23300 [Saccharothrix sp. ALI-22-I]|uniref:hypothetical protein n=1 Tax=Saccharothrix sp. ALI-22-I TaxID=1933778 RepID=UPI00097BC91C|nr:hypothetical protein [Saccharothrix sp. ALI-22-I]ONI87351.1 hypothetical protein ALI22I_23300 [Saccharothrix sp. ALI-22-I]